ncbi:hypothetical protein C3E78_12700 [Aeromicrobium chenweiae]|uniref:Uncharacterized protein n=1 Tax=Aeromicrobium chenweiae TaxID=2079793 RepID=A0A2S0WNT4_9ACTN|nr:hypothetical protein C3E78_12700 [Aeromicrobium chenweiae]
MAVSGLEASAAAISRCSIRSRASSAVATVRTSRASPTSSWRDWARTFAPLVVPTTSTRTPWGLGWWNPPR